MEWFMDNPWFFFSSYGDIYVMRYLLTFLLLSLISSSPIIAQDCHCTVTEVADNQVAACTKVIGNIVHVSTVNEFWAAIDQANNSGGNMTILIEDGTYLMATTSRYPYITASNLVIRSAHGRRNDVIITGTGMHDVAPGTEIGIFAVGDNITIADLTIREVGNHGIAARGDSLFVHNVRVQDAYEQLLKVSNGNEDGADHARVQCSLFEYTAGIGPQWYIGGLDVHNGNYWTVNDNVFKDITSPSQAVAEHAVHFWDNSSHNIVERNVIYNCDRGVGFGLGSSPHTGGVIRNNMIYNNGQGTFADVGIGLETSPDTKVYNNTIHIQYPNAIEYRFAATTGVDITNNLTNQQIRSRNGGTATLTTNLTTAEGSWYVDVQQGDLRLSNEISEVVDQGTDLGEEVADDIDKTTRYIDDGFDIGSFEYGEFTTHQQVVLSSESISIYPNPNQGTVTIGGDLSSFSIDILNQVGQIHTSLNGMTSPITVDLNSLPDGMYFLRVVNHTNGAVHLEKMIKQL